MTAAYVAPVVARLVQAHPKLSVEIVADDAAHDLVQDRIDVAVRMGAPITRDLSRRPGTAGPAITAAARPR